MSSNPIPAPAGSAPARSSRTARGRLLYLAVLLCFCIVPGSAQYDLDLSFDAIPDVPKTDEELKSRLDELAQRPVEKSEFELQQEYQILTRTVTELRQFVANDESQKEIGKYVEMLDAALPDFEARARALRTDLTTQYPDPATPFASLPLPARFGRIFPYLNLSPDDRSDPELAETFENYRMLAPSLKRSLLRAGAPSLLAQKDLVNLMSDPALAAYKGLLRRSLDYARKLQQERQGLKKNASALITAEGKRLEVISKRLLEIGTKKPEAVQTLIPVLPWLVLALCGLGFVLILAIRFFDSEVQLEWVASGQVIQFVTVLNLLIIILCLGIVGYLKENTLGTLLGGISGYVLSQGVGRAASRAATRALQRNNPNP